ncbi:His-Xaa-Ser system radical SAM maturase HxsC [Nitrosospira multiformis]|uniref:His-Xaa-Ser system radical SAM maturase HxsC n=1 Tax=Nitrosospira multiformis TaxID=1231 RepID=A0A2T5HYV0_9PROT|nr:His-Xaa-Ser system radical SAM maturase HxsC [Nitrosospira multiformis]PTQ76750.1 His-Xaa-Ser system radical SAM maturase HxsC [Nitrosospira multiformis]
MIHLHSRNNLALTPLSHKAPFISKITTNAHLPAALRPAHTLLWDGSCPLPSGFGLTLISGTTGGEQDLSSRLNVLRLAPELGYLKGHDVIKFHPVNSTIHVLYRKEANSNSFLVTERCNSFCIMCSQPPRDIDDRYLVDDMLAALPLIHSDTPEIGITGGEPTLWGDDFIRLIQASKTHLPRTALHILSNGRNFKSLELAVKVAQVKHPDLMIGIPLYADYSQLHDFIVQADNAFDDTLRGILNLKRCQVPVEIRVVLHQKNFRRLPKLAEFITRNLLFVDHVALMGLEIMGFAKSNFNGLWIDPYDYSEELEEATHTLARYGMRVSIYNHPLCVVPESVRQFAVRSISDWKNDFLEECQSCRSMNECGGFFSSNLAKPSAHIRAL